MARAQIRLAAALILVTLAGCTPESSQPPRKIDTAAPANAVNGVWRLDPTDEITNHSTEFVALVSDPTCNGGKAPTVYPPEIEYTDISIVVTFKIDPPGRDVGTCVLGEETRYTVELDQPIGLRRLEDGDCEGFLGPPGSRCDSARWGN
ncbi:MAG: hypothetical protein P1U38_14545 [Aeromicrobium sp.]|uniref:hypothetical protein n=1 Tax=Aeromicrobium sp. TaxID=1871063 RepID=UPI0026184829|nr:hypothetical protein [Aeromicrobium sp.]MDF1705983.1 hypothetical protein [Aeromicrobium sp.]